jgi:hypothetical protein
VSDQPPGPHLLASWLKRAREQIFSHYASEERYAKLHLYLGVPSAFFSAVVGTVVFASLQKDVSGWVKIALGLISIVAAVMIALQTFLKYSQLSDRHRVTASKYSAIRREIELLLEFQESGKAQDFSTLDAIRAKLDKAAEEAPNVPSHVWARALAVMERENRR